METKSLPDFTPIKLPERAVTPEYRNAIGRFRKWAGKAVHLGDARPLDVAEDKLFSLCDRLQDRALDAGLLVSELRGSTMTYTALIPWEMKKFYACCLMISMSVDRAGDVWVTGMSIHKPDTEPLSDLDSEMTERGQIERKKWAFQLSDTARTLAVACLLKERGIAQDLDVNFLSEEIEKQVAAARRELQ